MADQGEKSNRSGEIWKQEKPQESSYQSSSKSYEQEIGYDEIKKILETPHETFSEMLMRLVYEKEEEEPYLKDSDIFKKAEVTSSHFSKIRKNRNYNPKKGTVIAFAVALELSLEETEELLLSAGYGLSNTKKEDLVVKYFIEHKRYSVAAIEEALRDFGLPTLGRL